MFLLSSYLLLADSKKKFLNKGGLFTEFANKNKGTYDMKRVIKEQETKLPNYPVIKINNTARDSTMKKLSIIEKAKDVIDKNNLNRVRELLTQSK
jgi:hypothetical protein